jgi:hypothetical protein
MTIERIAFLFYLVNAYLLGRVFDVDDWTSSTKSIKSYILVLSVFIFGLHLTLLYFLCVHVEILYKHYNLRLTRTHFTYRKTMIVWSDRVSLRDGRVVLVSEYLTKKNIEVNKYNFFTIIKGK